MTLARSEHAPRWVGEGELVWMMHKGRWLLCQALVVAGNSVRVRNELHDVDFWVSTDELRLAIKGDANEAAAATATE